MVVIGNVFSILPVGGFEYDSHEVRLSYEGDSGFYAMVGGFVLDGEDTEFTGFGIFPLGGTDPITDFLPGQTPLPGITNTKARAIFGRVAVPLMQERLTLSAEARYTDEEKPTIASNMLFPYEDNYFTPRFGIDFAVTPDNLIYASVAKGVKSGGINNSSFPDLDPRRTYLRPRYQLDLRNRLKEYLW